VASGVRGIKMKGEDRVVGMGVVSEGEAGDQFMVITENGYGKRTALKEYNVQNRGGLGVRTAKITDRTGAIITGRIVKKKDSRDLLVISSGGQVIRMSVKSISSLGRATQGVRVMRFKKGDDQVSSVAFIDNESAAEAVEEAVKNVEAAQAPEKGAGKKTAKAKKPAEKAKKKASPKSSKAKPGKKKK